MKINQLNGQSVENSRKNIHNCVMKVMGKEENIESASLLNSILQATAMEILSTLNTNVEERRIIWTTYNNHKSWFDNWEHDLEDLGFSERDEEGGIYIPVEQLSRIINIDNFCLSLDGSNGQRGGHPEAVFYCPSLPQTGRATGKISLTTTLITGSRHMGSHSSSLPVFDEGSNSGDVEIEGGVGCLHASCTWKVWRPRGASMPHHRCDTIQG